MKHLHALFQTATSVTLFLALGLLVFVAVTPVAGGSAPFVELFSMFGLCLISAVLMNLTKPKPRTLFI